MRPPRNLTIVFGVCVIPAMSIWPIASLGWLHSPTLLGYVVLLNCCRPWRSESEKLVPISLASSKKNSCKASLA